MRSAAAALLACAFAAIYLGDVGHGFVKDDFMWVAASRLDVPGGAPRLLTASSGFFRPAVSASFGVNRLACGVDARCYGLVNLLLALACAGALFMLARALCLSEAAAIVAASLWAFNWHGVGTAVLWISGRTALLVTLFAVLAAAAFVRRRPWLALGSTILAMLSKEEATLVPVALLAWTAVERRSRDANRVAAVYAAGSAVAVIVYLALRRQSGAFTLTTAPAFYQLQFSPARLLENLPHYIDRTITFPLAIVIIWLLMTRPSRLDARPEARVAAFAALWWSFTLSVTIFLPVRSSLYGCLPSVGSALLAAHVIDRTNGRLPARQRRWMTVAGVLLPFALWPIYAIRNDPSVGEAELSTAAIAALRDVAAERGEGTVVILRDCRDEAATFERAFGTLVQPAADLMIRPPVRVWLDPPPADAAAAGLSGPPRPDVVLGCRNGAVVRMN